MNYNQATAEQLFTIAFHEPCSLTEKYNAMQELRKREKANHGAAQHRIVRKQA